MKFLDVGKVRVVAFDCVNTVFDVSRIDRKAYIDQVRDANANGWKPLVPDMSWFICPAWPDSAEGINRITAKYRTATCSNWSGWLLALMSSANGINWSAIVPMETVRAYKPTPIAYLNVANVMGVDPSQVLMVTANETAPDIETARNLGMQAILIDRENKHSQAPHTIIELAEMLGT